MIDIGASKYKAEKTVLFNGKTWHIKLPGARDELAISQTERRIKHIEKRVDGGSSTDEDLDKLDTLEEKLYGIYLNLFKDDTENNSEVRKWLSETSFSTIALVLEDIKNQAEDKLDAAEKASEELSQS